VIQHVCGDGTETVGVTLVRVRNPEAVTGKAGNGDSPPRKSSGWPPSSASLPGSSRPGARTAAASRRPGLPAWHAESRPAMTAYPTVLPLGRSRSVPHEPSG
jgi:hypothetical protein